MPTRLSGSAPESDSICPSASRRRASRSSAIASGAAYCSPLKPAMKRPPRISPRASSRRQHMSSSRHGGSQSASRASRRQKMTPQRRSSVRTTCSTVSASPACVAGSCAAGRAMRDQRPAASIPNSARRRRRRPAAAPRRRSAGTSSARSPGEAVGVHQAERDELRERLFGLRRQQRAARGELIEERGAVGRAGTAPRAARARTGAPGRSRW